tara:strand:+ start:403 stop:564 length:162 start_codon:yes stop_codon:yes gene_type:complete
MNKLIKMEIKKMADRLVEMDEDCLEMTEEEDRLRLTAVIALYKIFEGRRWEDE